MRVAAIDIGTNSVLLLVAERDAHGVLVPVVERATITRLGQGVDQHRRLAVEAIERTLACLAHYADEIRQLSVERLDVVGTSAMRDASGGEGFVARANEILGVPPRVISGEEEARLTFAGALGGLGIEAGTEVTVFDIGGGSTEIVRGRLESSRPVLSFAESLNIGSVRLFERFVKQDPPSLDELAAAESFVRDALLACSLENPGEPLVGIAGTVTTLAAVARGIQPYDGSKVHGLALSADEVKQVARRLAALPLAERKRIPGLEPERADVIVTGAIIVNAVLAWSGASELRVSDRGVRWGLAEELATP